MHVNRDKGLRKRVSVRVPKSFEIHPFDYFHTNPSITRSSFGDFLNFDVNV